jgi:DNA-binding NarL/FixJ family response regulator
VSPIESLNGMSESQKIILADDHDVLRKGMRSVLEQSDAFRVVGEAANGVELLNLLQQGIVPDTLILDLTMPGMSGLQVMAEIRKMHVSFRILVLTMHREPGIVCRAFSAGASGYLVKESIAAELWMALQDLHESKIYLSPSMQKELPDLCQIRAFARRAVPAGVLHCGKYGFCEPLLPV